MKTTAVNIYEMGPKEWRAIRLEALNVLHSGVVGKDEFRATILGFVTWLIKNNKHIEIELKADDELVH
jgi:aspartyl/asparaginyl beta-hydroxylase (cupin superfamily)